MGDRQRRRRNGADDRRRRQLGVLSWILATFVKTDPNTDDAFTISQTFIFSTWLTTMLASIVGTLMFTSEVQHGTFPGAVMAQPARWVMVTAKAAVASGFGLVMGIAGMTAGFAGAVLGGLDAGDSAGVAATVVWGLFLTSMASLFGLGVGMILRHGALATSTVLIWALVLENLIRGFAPPTVSRYMPFSAASGLLGIRQAGDTDEVAGDAVTGRRRRVFERVLRPQRRPPARSSSASNARESSAPRMYPIARSSSSTTKPCSGSSVT